MKIPEFFFAFINPMMKLLLNSPFHAIMSHSVLVLYFTGRKSGRRFSTPLRFHSEGETIRCFSSGETQWWRNFREPTTANIQMQGERLEYQGTLLQHDPERVRSLLVNYLTEFPADAVYHDVKRVRGRLDEEDLNKASTHCRIVEFNRQ